MNFSQSCEEKKEELSAVFSWRSWLRNESFRSGSFVVIISVSFFFVSVSGCTKDIFILFPT